MKIRRVLMEQAPYSEVQCDYCGYPMDLDEDIPHYYEVENHEHLAFCTRTCAIDYMHQAEYDMSDSATEGGYVIA